MLQAFFKVVAVVDDSGVLRSSAYIVSQEQLVSPSNLPDISRARLPVGTFRTFQVPVHEVERLTGLIWDDVIREADVMTRTGGPDARMAAAADDDEIDYTAGWRELGSLDDVQLGFRDQPAAAAAGRSAAERATSGIGKGFDANFLKIKVPMPAVTEAALEFGDVAPLRDGSKSAAGGWRGRKLQYVVQ